MRERVFNFSAGPAILPESVLKKAQAALWAFKDSGIGILEHSHRGKHFVKVIEETEANCRELAGINDDYDVLFLQGGASTQFFMMPMNWLGSDATADYIHTGTWSKNAIKEAKLFGKVHVAASSEAEGFNYVPRATDIQWSSSPVYVHYTSNNTIVGTQYDYIPAAPKDVPLICDASSDIFSRRVDFTKHGMVYAGAQKNLGPSGLALVVIRKSLVEQGDSHLSTMLQYRTHAAAGSCFNTPPTFGIYIMGEVFKWIKEQGGLGAIAEVNTAKANLLYSYLDESKMFSGTARTDSRSQMNITFLAKTPALSAQFIKEATAQGLSGLGGHRSVGGMRASIYNAFPLEGVQELVSFMKAFETKN